MSKTVINHHHHHHHHHAGAGDEATTTTTHNIVVGEELGGEAAENSELVSPHADNAISLNNGDIGVGNDELGTPDFVLEGMKASEAKAESNSGGHTPRVDVDVDGGVLSGEDLIAQLLLAPPSGTYGY